MCGHINLTYIHKQSNPLLSIVKNLPKSIHKRLSTNSKIAQIFNEPCPPYKEALKKEWIQHKSTL